MKASPMLNRNKLSVLEEMSAEQEDLKELLVKSKKEHMMYFETVLPW